MFLISTVLKFSLTGWGFHVGIVLYWLHLMYLKEVAVGYEILVRLMCFPSCILKRNHVVGCLLEAVTFPSVSSDSRKNIIVWQNSGIILYLLDVSTLLQSGKSWACVYLSVHVARVSTHWGWSSNTNSLNPFLEKECSHLNFLFIFFLQCM